MRGAAIVAAVAILAASLTACSGVQKQLGIGEKQAPDEFRVVSQAPLSLPPDFKLRPPEPGAARPQVGTPTEQARSSVFRLEPARTPSPAYSATGQRTSGELALARMVGAEQVDPNIRQIVNLETSQINEESGNFIDSLLFWREPLPPGTVVDADAEAQRLRTNRALNRPANTGETPTIKRRERAIFEGIFN